MGGAHLQNIQSYIQQYGNVTARQEESLEQELSPPEDEDTGDDAEDAAAGDGVAAAVVCDVVIVAVLLTVGAPALLNLK